MLCCCGSPASHLSARPRSSAPALPRMERRCGTAFRSSPRRTCGSGGRSPEAAPRAATTDHDKTLRRLTLRLQLSALAPAERQHHLAATSRFSARWKRSGSCRTATRQPGERARQPSALLSFHSSRCYLERSEGGGLLLGTLGSAVGAHVRGVRSCCRDRTFREPNLGCPREGEFNEAGHRWSLEFC